MLKRRWYALFGVVATLVGMAVGHVMAALLSTPDSSPVLAVGSGVIDRTPASMKEWAIKHFESDGFSIGPIDFAARNYDKIVLVGSVFVGVLVLAAVAGVLTRRRFAIGAGMLVVLVAIAGGAVLDRPVVQAIDVVPALFTAVAGVAALWWLDRSARGLPLDPRARSTVEVAKAEAETDTDTETDTGSPRPSRRGVLIAGAVLTAAAAALGGAGRLINSIRARAEDITLPKPAPGEALQPLPAGLESKVPGISPMRVPNKDFYIVDTRLDVPVVDSATWSLKVDGDVGKEIEISFDELLAMPMVERDITLTCVSNSVGGKYVGAARWLGVPLKDIIEMAGGLGDTTDQMLATDFDGMTIGTPVDLLMDGREALLAVGMNGEQLPREHGFPARIIIPGLYGFISATKWVTRLNFTTYAEQDSYWTKKKWGTRAPIKPSARIDTPRPVSTSKPNADGEVLIGGVAWAQNDMGVMKVQVQVDGQGWEEAMLGPDVNNVYWRQWYYPAQLGSGTHKISARVVDGAGATQTDVRAIPFPDGASGIHTISILVA